MPKRKPPRNDTRPSGRPRKLTALGTREVDNLRAKIALMSANPTPQNIAGLVCAYLEADLCNLITPEIMGRAKGFIDVLHKKYDPKVIQSFNFGELDGGAPDSLSTESKDQRLIIGEDGGSNDNPQA